MTEKEKLQEIYRLVVRAWTIANTLDNSEEMYVDGIEEVRDLLDSLDSVLSFLIDTDDDEGETKNEMQKI